MARRISVNAYAPLSIFGKGGNPPSCVLTLVTDTYAVSRKRRGDLIFDLIFFFIHDLENQEGSKGPLPRRFAMGYSTDALSVLEP